MSTLALNQSSRRIKKPEVAAAAAAVVVAVIARVNPDANAPVITALTGRFRETSMSALGRLLSIERNI